MSAIFLNDLPKMNAPPARYDLHSHTTASDGVLTPAQLVRRATEMGVSVLAITDHDTVDGLAEAAQTISSESLSLTLISGIEISTQWENHEIHIVGLNINPTAPALDQLIQQQKVRRQTRAREIARRLEKARIPGAWQGVMRIAGDVGVTRGHFARYLIEQGYATSTTNVFKHFLSKGKTGYVPPQWCTIEEAVTVIHQAGGLAVLAHPGRYRLSAKWLKRLLMWFKECGGDAIEVAQCQQAVDERERLSAYAVQFALLASQGSDFHQPVEWMELGHKLWLPDSVKPVWYGWGDTP